jgi:ribose/xylose/arabinose/galactoside ABC-type transport system permease subunit
MAQLTPPVAHSSPLAAAVQDRRRRLPRLQQAGLLVVIILLGLLLTFAGGSITLRGQTVNNFFRPDNLLPNVLTPMSWMAIMAVGGTFVIVAGGIDISVGSVFGLAALACAAVLQRFPEDASPWQVLPLAATVPLAVGLLCGLLNGALVVGLRMHPFIVTLGTMSIFRGIALVSVAAGSLPEGDRSLPEAFTRRLMMYQMTYQRPSGMLVSLQPVPVLIMLACVLIGWVFLSLTVWGRETYAIGGNEEAARFSGLRVGFVKLRVYALSGLFAGIAAMVSTGYYGSASTKTGDGYELMVIAAAVVGGASLSGGRGTAFGAMLGMLIIQMIDNGISIVKRIDLWFAVLPLSREYSKIIIGVAIILAVAVDRLGEYVQQRRMRTRS